MKKGFYPKLAWDVLRKNKRMYFPYILASSVMVMMFYILMSMLHSPDLKDIKGGSVLMKMLPYGCGVIAIFSLIFLFYTNSFLIKQRYREFGLYNVLGMDKRNINRLMLWEGIYTAEISIGAGLVCGMAFSKAAELVLMNIIDEEISFTLHISIKSLIVTALIYLGISGLLLINSFIKVRRSKPLELMQSSQAGEKKLKCNWLFAIVGAVLLGCAYYLAVRIENPTYALTTFFTAVMMVIIATYLLFISGSVAVCKLLQKNKKYYYKSNHFVSVSSMAYRMKRNGAGLASICILLTIVLVVLSSTISVYFGEEDSINSCYPNGINITYNFDTIDKISDKTLNEQRDIIARYAPSGTDLTGKWYAVLAGKFTGNGIILETTNVGDIEGCLSILSLADYNKMMGENKTLESGECLLYSDRLKLPWETFTIEGYGDTYSVKERLTAFQGDGANKTKGVHYVYLVVPDVAAFVEPVADLKISYGQSVLNYKWSLGFNCSTDEEEIAVMDELLSALAKHEANNYSYNPLYFSLESREQARLGFFEVYSSLFFLGIMLSVVFLMAAVLIIYYKQISEGYEDKSRFEIMQKVGMTKKDIRKSINSQMLTVFFLPIVMSGLHLGFAFPCISKILELFDFYNMFLNAMVTLGCFAVFGVFYGIVYKITSGSYYAIVSGRKEQ